MNEIANFFLLFEDVSPIEETTSGKKREKVTRLPLDQFLIARVLDHQVMIRTFQILHADFQLFVDFQPRIVHLPQGGSLLFHVLQNEQITRVFIEQCNFEVERLRKSCIAAKIFLLCPTIVAGTL